MADDIVDEDELYRRVFGYQVERDGSVNSSAFKLRKPKRPDPSISVDLARMTTPQESLGRGGARGLGLAGIKAGIPPSLGLDVRRDPLPDNPAHCLIEGATTMEQCSILASHCTLIVPPLERPVKES